MVTKKKNSKKKGGDQNILLTILLGVFIILTLLQSFQLQNLENKIEEGKISVGASSTVYGQSGGGSGGGAVPSNIADLPQMVGGC